MKGLVRHVRDVSGVESLKNVVVSLKGIDEYHGGGPLSMCFATSSFCRMEAGYNNMGPGTDSDPPQYWTASA
jgi:hypothetical protein